MTATLDGVAARKKDKPEPSAEQKLPEELVARAREQGVSLTGPDGLLKRLNKTVLETALNQEMTEHLGHDKHGLASNETENAPNAPRTPMTAGGISSGSPLRQGRCPADPRDGPNGLASRPGALVCAGPAPAHPPLSTAWSTTSSPTRPSTNAASKLSADHPFRSSAAATRAAQSDVRNDGE